MLNLNSILTFVFVTFFSVISLAQPLTNGMGIITHWTGFSGEWDAFSIYETEDNASATLGQNWATNFNTPADQIAHNSWKGTNMGDVFGITIDVDKNVYFRCKFHVLPIRCT